MSDPPPPPAVSTQGDAESLFSDTSPASAQLRLGDGVTRDVWTMETGHRWLPGNGMRRYGVGYDTGRVTGVVRVCTDTASMYPLASGHRRLRFSLSHG